MIIKRLRKLVKLGMLIAVRQGYFLGRNIYELYYQPYLTIKELVEKQDKSQMLLVALAAMTPAITYVLARIVYDLIKFGRLVALTGNVFLIMGMIQMLVLAYLGYWALMVIRNSKNV